MKGTSSGKTTPANALRQHTTGSRRNLVGSKSKDGKSLNNSHDDNKANEKDSPASTLDANRDESGSDAFTQRSVVASLEQRSPHPFSVISLSPNRQFAVTASKDTLQIVKIDPHKGLILVKSLPVAHHFQTSPGTGATKMGRVFTFDNNNNNNSSAGGNQQSNQRGGINAGTGSIIGGGTNTGTVGNAGSLFVKDAFNLRGLASATAASSPAGSLMNVVITAVEWSGPQQQVESEPERTLIAAGGSNGVIAIWHAEGLLQSQPVMPEAILSQHVRAVNRLSWHPTKPGLLLSALHGSTALLWERKLKSTLPEHNVSPAVPKKPQSTWFGGAWGAKLASEPASSYTWRCRTFEPKSEPIRDIQWSPFMDDVFALVTASGSLIGYNRFLHHRTLFKITAHSGEATTLDWHPQRMYIVATGGAIDRSVKIWDLESYFLMNKDESNIGYNYGTATSRSESVASDGSSESVRSVPTAIGQVITINSRTYNSNASNSNSSRHRIGSERALHVLSIAASVTRLKWRPPANESFQGQSGTSISTVGSEDRHDSMIAVATAPVKGTSAGGQGLLSLWSHHRPFMPLSVMRGHEEGAVTDFEWLDTPQVNDITAANNNVKKLAAKQPAPALDFRRGIMGSLNDSLEQGRPRKLSDADKVSFERNKQVVNVVRIWQHAISVGRDGRCLIQSFVRGDRPITRVSPSCFAMANLSPFQTGYGSLQIFSIHQKVPRDLQSEFLLTGLRQDRVTAKAPSLFREIPQSAEMDNIGLDSSDEVNADLLCQIPSQSPLLTFNIVDQGELNEQARPTTCESEILTVCPEVVHLSRFASNYILYPNKDYPTRVSICLENAEVAERLRSKSLANVWRIVASMLNSAGIDVLSDEYSAPSNAMQFILMPSFKGMLEERADAGDVQTCVALCEVLQVLTPTGTTRIRGLDIRIVREWYLTYIDLLQDMCLFSNATYLIRNCNDPYIGALNQQSTTIHEACPTCGKALSSTATTDFDQGGPARRTCNSCRRRVGLCFLCHEPVKGMYVWCPGCGHGGHLEHALQWFGGLSGRPVREVCPTGCGHKCNLMQTLNSFPRTDSLREFHGLSE